MYVNEQSCIWFSKYNSYCPGSSFVDWKNVINMSVKIYNWLMNISSRKYSPDIIHILKISNISLHKYTQKMQHKNLLFIQEFSNWQFKHVQLLNCTENVVYTKSLSNICMCHIDNISWCLIYSFTFNLVAYCNWFKNRWPFSKVHVLCLIDLSTNHFNSAYVLFSICWSAFLCHDFC